jgi:pimeloyl-ACP methyl ester carboxylesterase
MATGAVRRRMSGATMEHRIKTPDGRTLAVQEDGDPNGKPVLAHNGTPNSRQLYGRHVADAGARGIRLISYDRPGYGASDPQPGRTVASAADDVRTICSALGISRLATWGVSGGGPHVLACAALLPDLVVAAASLASPAPYPAEGLDWFAGMGQENVDDFRLLLNDPPAAWAKTEKDREAMLAVNAADLYAEFASLLTPTDAAALTGPLAEWLTSSAKDGLAPGAAGWMEDGLATAGQPWGFALTGITVPVLLMHGRQDQFVPFGHGQWLAARIPGVEARLLDHDGHLTLTESRIGEVHSWLLSRL